MVQIEEKPRWDFRTLEIGKTPRRVLYDSTTRALLVATTVKGGSSLISEVLLVDPATGFTLLKETLPRNEVVYSLNIWKVKQDKRYIALGTYGYRETPDGPAQSRVLVYNLKSYEGGAGGGGRPVYKLKRLGDRVLPGMVHAVCSFMNRLVPFLMSLEPRDARRSAQLFLRIRKLNDVGVDSTRSYLVAAADTTLYQLKIDAGTRKLVTGAQLNMRWPIQSLSPFGKYIAVGGHRESVSMVQYDMRLKQFVFIKSDRVPKVVADCLAIDERTVLATDKFGAVFGVVVEDDNSIEQSVDTSFHYNLGESVMRLRMGRLTPLPTPPCSPSTTTLPTTFRHSAFPLPTTDSSFADDDGAFDIGWGAETSGEMEFGSRSSEEESVGRQAVVYGCGMLGSLFSFLRIGRDVWEVLWGVQRVLGVFDGTRPLLGNNHTTYRYPPNPGTPPTTPQTGGCIDGEFVSQFLTLSNTDQNRVMELYRNVATDENRRAAIRDVSVADVCRVIEGLNSRCG
ncbi:hypothetical protein HDV00_008503 [Rhizophlyctis rosea]|nr:hypothetical protein HDV00_008503 [Rhizophlyctis rosea]